MYCTNINEILFKGAYALNIYFWFGQLARVKNPAGILAFSERLRTLRRDKGYSQQKLADIANLEQSTIKRIELAQLNPTLDVLISLSRALGLEVRDLVDDPAITNSDREV